MMNLIQIENRSGKVSLNDTVHKESADKLLDEIGKLYGSKAVLAEMKIGEIVCKDDDALTTLELEINSPGGSVMEGHRIYNALRDASMRGVNVVTTANGVCASMGSVVLMGGDERRMTKGSRIMIHDASTMAQGNAASIQRTADLLESISSEIAGIYAERSGQDKETMRDLMKAETWMDADKAMEYGFIHSVQNYKVDKTAENNNTSGMSILAKLFPGNDQVAQLEMQVAENDSLRAEITELKAQIDGISDIQTELIESKVKIETLEAQVSKIAVLEADLAAEKLKVEAAKASAGAQAIEALAAVGQPVALEIAAEVTPEKQSISHLHGYAKVAASFASK
jgi:ATP-dependent Clp endopeptidase proteolytic subunit ClpP